jgi:uncharacterized protein (TIGR00730 family)
MPSSKDAIHHDPATQEAIQKLVSGIATGRRADLLTDMMKTVVGYGLDDASIGDLKLVSRSMSEMRYAASVFQEYNKVRKVAVFGSARTKSDEADFQLAREFSRRIVEENFMIITGGGDGIMGAAQQGAGAEKSFGLNIRLPFEQSANQVILGDPKLINFNYFFARKLSFVKETSAFVLFPGGFGTLDEGFEVLTLLQTGKTSIVPIILMDRPNGFYWETWRRFMDNDILELGLISRSDFHLFTITHDIDRAVNEIKHFYKVFHSYRWVRDEMVIRINKKLTPAALENLNQQFDHLLISGHIVLRDALPEEADERDLIHLPRLVLIPHKREFGMLRLLINAINDSQVIETPHDEAIHAPGIPSTRD